MTYIDYLNQFWKQAECYDMLTSEIALYAFLLNECNCNFWRMPFECSSCKICKTLRMSKQTLVDARQRLLDKGFIDFIPGLSRYVPSKYVLLDLTGHLTLTCAGNSISRNFKTNHSHLRVPEKVFQIDELMKVMQADLEWQNNIIMFFSEEKKSLTPELLNAYISKFIRYLKATSVKEKDIQDAKTHFVHWLKKNMSKEKRRKSRKDVGLILEESDTDKYKSINGWK